LPSGQHGEHGDYDGKTNYRAGYEIGCLRQSFSFADTLEIRVGPGETIHLVTRPANAIVGSARHAPRRGVLRAHAQPLFLARSDIVFVVTTGNNFVT
jgi:hypothetical protein